MRLSTNKQGVFTTSITLYAANGGLHSLDIVISVKLSYRKVLKRDQREFSCDVLWHGIVQRYNKYENLETAVGF
ncbi:hypothetical protein ES703_17861 [subsurface metagenome]